MVKMVTLFLFIMVMVTHMAFLLVICCPNVDHKVRLKTKPNVRKKQEVIPAEVFLFSQDANQLCRSKHIKHICLSPLRCYSLSYSPSVSITIKRTCPVVQISWWHHLGPLATFRTASSWLSYWGHSIYVLPTVLQQCWGFFQALPRFSCICQKSRLSSSFFWLQCFANCSLPAI